MRIQVLGCSGGVGPDLRTTSLLIDDHILIDAGSGVGDLSLAEMGRIKQIYLTHSHLDHICGLAFMADNLFDLVEDPIVVHALPATIDALRRHIFNWVIWPDFTELPNTQNPIMQFKPIQPLQAEIAPGPLQITPFPVNHTVPAVGYSVLGDSGVFAFSGDTAASDSLWAHLNGLPRLDKLMIEIAFPNEQAEIGSTSRHFTPDSLGRELAKLRHRPQLLLTHHKPGSEVVIASQCIRALEGWDYHHLRRGDLIEI
ncbi:MAG: 3,5-cyclic-nucleotide phosphodiesterase [Hydrocarboniphaga sp.]|uniref:3',5'-cyclic-nucleotide phosphodiesterase n=1 Tax=Hydrocarboniphaga sp. TaxID=2033016 RepID=UPI00261F3DA0|nr:3',5'-cyclic-nucleotide phosphodiesterase [Hydrocarboniphaga sp.]MDB5971838.1 3,5-cyclic-nucleotide phosphodiesterase [Hydrocarboniphaga sp.]